MRLSFGFPGNQLQTDKQSPTEMDRIMMLQFMLTY